MPKQPEKPKKGKIEVDKDFLDKVVKSNAAIQEKMGAMAEEIIKLKQAKPNESTVTIGGQKVEIQKDFTVKSELIFFYPQVPPTPEQKEHQEKVVNKAFVQAVLKLMQQHNIGMVNVALVKRPPKLTPPSSL